MYNSPDEIEPPRSSASAFRRVGVTVANLSILKTGKARAMRFSTLDALCRELNCQPGDLLAHVPGPQQTDDDGDA